MTRKRFVKLLMSRGYTRNEANSKAQAAVSAGVTYENGYFAVRIEAGDIEALSAVQAACNRIAEAMKSVAEALVHMINALAAAMPILAEMARRQDWRI